MTIVIFPPEESPASAFKMPYTAHAEINSRADRT